MKKKIIGRLDRANFPELNLKDISIKIDTGAYTSSIHCENIEEKEDGLHCTFLDKEHPEYDHKPFVFNTYNKIRVKSSNGIAQSRYEIKSKIEIFGKVYKISLSLSNRKEMKHPVLLGRKFLNKKFIVDSELKNLSHNIHHHEH
ncbi:RimK/LysX family protein [Psychroflexus sp. CAK57W]|uniref:ATP-dependent zinc protease family protein n=1 Tax=Psychroflexus curvus TaxID=2873595 RepID=UPI001CD02E10|nr:RimK/LysX family protein [Psychroflexus curvus]MBZ9629018.1 RimK/LysX family protein [Psychroflexus curvus]MBZ9787401.1 RimK/LysX family protein [Psychroflexus curvus]